MISCGISHGIYGGRRSPGTVALGRSLRDVVGKSLATHGALSQVSDVGPETEFCVADEEAGREAETKKQATKESRGSSEGKRSPGYDCPRGLSSSMAPSSLPPRRTKNARNRPLFLVLFQQP